MGTASVHHRTHSTYQPYRRSELTNGYCGHAKSSTRPARAPPARIQSFNAAPCNGDPLPTDFRTTTVSGLAAGSAMRVANKQLSLHEWIWEFSTARCENEQHSSEGAASPTSAVALSSKPTPLTSAALCTD